MFMIQGPPPCICHHPHPQNRALAVPVESSALPHLLSDAQRDLVVFDMEIKRVSHILSNLVKGREETQEYIDELQMRLSPVLRLPSELLQVIFTEASFLGPREDIASKNLCVPDKFLGTGITPLNLAGVCHRWRDIILNMPHLWSSFSLSLDTRLLTSPQTLHKLKLYLERSEYLPLDVRIHGNYFIRTATNEEISRFMSALIASAQRWHSLDIASPSIHAGWDTHVASLFDLLNTSGVVVPGTYPIRTLALNEAPYLDSKKLQISRTLFSNVTTLKISPGLKLHRVWSTGILYAMPSLEDLTIELACVPDEVLAINSFTMLKIRSLTIIVSFQRGNPHDALAVLFDGFTLPALSSLTLKNEHILRPKKQWPGQEVVDFLVRSGCDLEKLELSQIQMSEKEFEEIVRVTSTVVDRRPVNWPGGHKQESV
ncbi:hypothetical protein VNI00_006903 [Paramarasmius palmivorus]|uniref:F-box domain-containing protein n=1 Tax=Paramarasmius palmivorus TaxID=297713 RepID=A0AAW0D8B1_9AGAR